jgi:hypothetical protein
MITSGLSVRFRGAGSSSRHSNVLIALIILIFGVPAQIEEQSVGTWTYYQNAPRSSRTSHLQTVPSGFSWGTNIRATAFAHRSEGTLFHFRCHHGPAASGGGLVGDTGLEPVTSCMSSKCSNQLS